MNVERRRRGADRLQVLKSRFLCVVQTSSGPWLVKARHAEPGVRVPWVAGSYARERHALEALRGLAVPQWRAVSARMRASLFGDAGVECAARTFLRGRPLDGAALTMPQRLGAWLFVLEQLAAARARGIINTDLKPDNIVLRKRPLSCWIVDFDGVVAVRADGRYAHDEIILTPGYQAPELARSGPVSESAFVYQAGILLFSLCGAPEGTARSVDAQSLAEAHRALERAGAPDASRWMAELVAHDPRRRPAGYAQAWARVRADLQGSKPPGVPAESVRFWKKLRAPYDAALAAEERR